MAMNFTFYHLLKQPLANLINPQHPLCKLTKRIPWKEIEHHFFGLYANTDRPAKPIRLMVSLLILKQLYNLSDESMVDRWIKNPCFQFFSGETVFQWSFPYHSTDLVYFQKRIGEEGMRKIFQVSIALHGKKAKEKEVVVDTTVQEKNITFPTDTKLCKRIIEHCVDIATKERTPPSSELSKNNQEAYACPKVSESSKESKEGCGCPKKAKNHCWSISQRA